ncbi:hypothetical protein NEMIN01_1237 [Nematocida minor]|uniref:uncharacterized protein n=1 Tax=Nematocida minor TaxID=1912983 RepID=UPI0022207840|nr:uncharacterized protein NEMIN01_1237 [Nematocida minor]KAI5190835.1 hypothetical protein NEMIN01_1237 [Nematocida minor]
MAADTQKYKELKFKNVEEVKNALSQLTPEEASLKESLLRCYILNLILYNQLEENHPIKKTLITLSVYIDLVDKAKKSEEVAGSNIIKETEDLLLPNTENRRPIDYHMQKNKSVTDKKTRVNPEKRNARIKNKRKYEDAHELARKVKKENPNIVRKLK